MRPLLLPLLFLSAAASLAHADTFQFSFSGVYTVYPGDPVVGPISPGTNLTFSFQLSGAPTYNPSQDDFPFYSYPSIPVSGNSTTFSGPYDLELSTDSDPMFPQQDVGFLPNNSSTDSFDFADLETATHFFAGPGSDPIFMPGVYDATLDYRVYSDYVGTLTVADLSTSATPTPEPSTLLLLGTGLASAARLLRRKRHAS